MWVKVVLRILAGLACGYLAYLPVLFVVEYAAYGRIDNEKVFYALYCPLEAPYLVLPSLWKYASSDEIILRIIGGSFLLTGVLLSLRGVKKTRGGGASPL